MGIAVGIGIGITTPLGKLGGASAGVGATNRLVMSLAPLNVGSGMEFVKVVSKRNDRKEVRKRLENK